MKLPLTLAWSSAGPDFVVESEGENTKPVAIPPEFARMDPLRKMQIVGLDAYVASKAHLLTGRVLDFGCGKPGTCRVPQPYRKYCTGEYVGVDKGDFPRGKFDAILCTEVMAYLSLPIGAMESLYWHLADNGHVIITYTAAWPECEETSLWRFTAAGMRYLLERAGFSEIETTCIAQVQIGGNTLAISHGTVATKK